MNPFKIIKESASAVTDIVDRFVTTPDEKAQIKKDIEDELSKRWLSDNEGSWLTRSVRPLSLISVLVIFFIMLFTDGNVGNFTIQKEYIPVYQILLITIVGGYFAVRTIDKKGRIK
tara:strand:- start:553 stop:900 length:348 start_codon:yes stop_codon:yes gene_type:complete